MSNIIEQYSDRPNIVDQLCLAEFAAYYYKDYKKDSDEFSDVQPNVLSDLVESNHISNCESVLPPLTIKLNNGQETMKRRKIKVVLRFHKPSKGQKGMPCQMSKKSRSRSCYSRFRSFGVDGARTKMCN